MTVSTLDLYLAQAFVSYPAIWSQLAERGADEVEARAVHRWILDMDTHRMEDETLAKYIDLFGPPTEIRDGLNLWSLGLWPDHQWSIAFHEIGWSATSIGIVRRIPGHPRRDELRFGYDTFAEVRSALGEAPKSDGWWPWESWEYQEPDGSPLQCVFVHGVLVAMKNEAIEG